MNEIKAVLFSVKADINQSHTQVKLFTESKLLTAADLFHIHECGKRIVSAEKVDFGDFFAVLMLHFFTP